jgi:hypothetical protein
MRVLAIALQAVKIVASTQVVAGFMGGEEYELSVVCSDDPRGTIGNINVLAALGRPIKDDFFCAQSHAHRPEVTGAGVTTAVRIAPVVFAAAWAAVLNR